MAPAGECAEKGGADAGLWVRPGQRKPRVPSPGPTSGQRQSLACSSLDPAALLAVPVRYGRLLTLRDEHTRSERSVQQNSSRSAVADWRLDVSFAGRHASTCRRCSSVTEFLVESPLRNAGGVARPGYGQVPVARRGHGDSAVAAKGDEIESQR